ncbi:DUF5681 domain-containing protein [Methylobacterium sp. J-026]|uniref:DUF5681 domain-containing protein n=1 Tax=Methylobacterium sp. J-026 TaxID=2836624 RepID=UPI001FB87A4C|nr:DUF5681 domain-containing protein [Methylobacterium sp. J-026]MCJ2136483.1 DUF5681 domain-containing protein [Methylobacterium sp. J-026]
MPKEEGQFEQGRSGNPAGRPKGARNRATAALEKILDGDAEAILNKAVEMAKDGDPVAMRLCLDRLIPVRRDRPITFTLPPIDKPADLTRATHALMQGVAAGEITPSEAAELSKLVDAHVNAIKTADLAERLARIEEGGLL